MLLLVLQFRKEIVSQHLGRLRMTTSVGPYWIRNETLGGGGERKVKFETNLQE